MMNIVLNALNSLQYTQRHKDLHNYNYRSMIHARIIMQAIAGSMQAIAGWAMHAWCEHIAVQAMMQLVHASYYFWFM